MNNNANKTDLTGDFKTDAILKEIRGNEIPADAGEFILEWQRLQYQLYALTITAMMKNSVMWADLCGEDSPAEAITKTLFDLEAGAYKAATQMLGEVKL